VTVSLVTFNGMRWLPGCLSSLESQTLRDFELRVIDNASTDGSFEWLRAQAGRFPAVPMKVIASDTNLGFAAAQNRNIEAAPTEFVCLLNQDVVLHERFLERAVAAFDRGDRIAAVQGKLLRLNPDGSRSDIVDSTGLEMFPSRRVVSRGQGKPDTHRWSVPGPVWGADGPAPVYLWAALMDVREPRTGGGLEVLDEDFFMYKEDVDLAWRLRRAGWGSWYEPTAVAWHARTAAAGDASSLVSVAKSNWQIEPWIKARSWRNQRLMQIKNESGRDLVRDIVPIAAREMSSFAFAAVFDRKRLDLPGLVRSARKAVRKRQQRGSS
jgi:GT2 family glycosyltransferase